MGNFLKRTSRFLRDIAYATTIASKVYALRLVGEARRAKSIMDLVDVAFMLECHYLGR